jgi:hypothetical protein
VGDEVNTQNSKDSVYFKNLRNFKKVKSDDETVRLLSQIFIQRSPFNQSFIQRLRFGIEKAFNLKTETVTFTKVFD